MGETQVRLARGDVDQALNLPAGECAGFAFFSSAPALFGCPKAELKVFALFADNSRELVQMSMISPIAHDYRGNHYGSLADPCMMVVHHRNDIYSSGPSAPEPSPECLQLITSRLGSPPSHILDVGCGIGAYGRPLLEAGYNWLGVEVKASDCASLTSLGLPHHKVDGRTLPFSNGSFDTTLCIEVLEHIADPVPFLNEIRRVTRQRLLLSVPNLEIIPYMQPHMAVPWHLLEGDHKNFFTRSSLGALLRAHFSQVEVICYAVAPLKTVEGLPLYYHLFADAHI